MTSYLDWASLRLSGAPAGACVFWVDLDQLLSSRNHGGLAESETQPFMTEDGIEWQVVRFRANPFPARQALRDSSLRTVIWCVGMPGDEAVDLTAFEDHFGRTYGVLDVSLTAFAEDQAPGLNIPRALGSTISGIEVDIGAYLQHLRHSHGDVPLNMFSAVNTLASFLTNRDRAVVASDAANVLASVASALAAAESPNAVAAVQLAATVAAEGNLRLKPLLEEIASQDPQDLVTLAYVASGLVRQAVANVGSVLAADGWLTPPLRSAFDGTDGRWDSIPALLDSQDLTAIARRVEPTLNPTKIGRLREVLGASKSPIAAVVDEPLPGICLATILARFDEFSHSQSSIAGAGRATDDWENELVALDLVAHGLRIADDLGNGTEKERDMLQFAEAFIRSKASAAHLAIGRAKLAFRSVETLLPPVQARDVSAGLASATAQANEALDRWDEGWRAILERDVQGFLRHPRQGWQLSGEFASGGSGKTSWLLVFDGLRYDLWREVLIPAVQNAGWKVDGSDVSFAFLPSITEVSRRTVIGGSPSVTRSQEEATAKALAQRAGEQLTYLVRTEVSEKHMDPAGGWNVRVFSWPDKLVHSDIADLGTLTAQFEKWVNDELVGWFKRNISADARVAITTDHGFAELGDDVAIDVGVSAGEERNLPRVLAEDRELGMRGLRVPDGVHQATVASTRSWFRTPGARRWRFAHGGSTLHEVVVPFAILAPVKEGAAQFSVEGLLPALELEEGSTFNLKFIALIAGGPEMFPTVTVTGLTQLVRKSVQRGEPTAIVAPVQAIDGLDRLFIRLQSGPERYDVSVPVTVKLAKVKRPALDFDF